MAKKKQTSTRVLMSVSLPADQTDAMDAWRKAQPAVPGRSAVIRAAVQEFLARHSKEG